MSVIQCPGQYLRLEKFNEISCGFSDIIPESSSIQFELKHGYNKASHLTLFDYTTPQTFHEISVFDASQQNVFNMSRISSTTPKIP